MAFTCLATTWATGQTVKSVYNRDTHAPFHLKKVSVESTVIGPLVRTDTLLTYDNPYNTLTEATLNFDLPANGALGGFAYFYGQEYVAGRLLDKQKAWQIYTAITSRNRDPGIMEQWSPTSYHCQIYPIRKGEDLKIRLWAVGMLEPNGGNEFSLPKPRVPRAVGYDAVDASTMEPDWKVRSVKSTPILQVGNAYRVAMNGSAEAIAERFKDGRVYVAGLIRRNVDSAPSNIEIENAQYEPLRGDGKGLDVTQKVAAMVRQGRVRIPATNAEFGDPNPNEFKCLIVKYKSGGRALSRLAQEHDTLDLVPYSDGTSRPIALMGLRETRYVAMDANTAAFSGWMPKNRAIHATVGDKTFSFKPIVAKGSDTARIWAQQMLANHSEWDVRRTLAFSLKYGTPSTATALLAVPKEEWKNYLAREAEARRKALEASRVHRGWAGRRNQNWNASGGGDPEIRISIPGAKSVQAILPDRRVLELTADGDTWGGNFEIPATALEGTYTVKIVATMTDGSAQERTWTYDVDRTPPKGHAEFLQEDGVLILQVTSESGLAEVAAYFEGGEKLVLKESKPGTYRAIVSHRVHFKIVMKDRAGNKGELDLR